MRNGAQRVTILPTHRNWVGGDPLSTTRYYPTDVTEAQRTLLLSLLPARQWRPGGPGRPPCDRQQGRKGIWYLLKTGCQWRRWPREFGKWNTVYSYFKCGREAGVWAKLREAVRPSKSAIIASCWPSTALRYAQAERSE